MHVLQASSLTKIYGQQPGAVVTLALDGLDLDVAAGEFLGIMGPPGSGKTTLLQLLGTIDRPTSGDIWIGGQHLTGLQGNDLAHFRRRHLGFISQEFKLMESLTLRENMLIPLLLEGHPVGEIEAKLASLARRLQFLQHILDVQAATDLSAEPTTGSGR